jgi:hypothetical protein
MARIESGHDEVRALVLALIEKLGAKKQNYGAVRACEPFLTEKDCAELLARVPVITQELAAERRAAAGLRPSGLLLPRGASGT